LESPALLKIDVQGGELDVLSGSDDLLGCFDAVYVECSYLQMYEGQPLVEDINDWMGERGFRMSGVYNQHNDRQRGAVQADFLFTRARSSAASCEVPR
jgi:hypothetical protein